MHTSICTHTNTHERKKCTRTNPYPRKPLARNSWKGIFSHHPQPSLSPDPPAGVCSSVQRGWPPPSATPLPVESGSVCATWTDLSSLILPRDVSVPVCATWAGTSSRPSLPTSSPPYTPGGRFICRGNRLPSRPAPRPANRAVTGPRLAFRDLRFPRRPTTCIMPYARCSLSPRPCHPPLAHPT
jgi:hypothetical protein